MLICIGVAQGLIPSVPLLPVNQLLNLSPIDELGS